MRTPPPVPEPAATGPVAGVDDVVDAKATLRARLRTARRDRSPQALLEEALPVWVSQLKPGGAIGLSWNTHGLAREALVSSLQKLDLRVLDEGPWLDFSHRVDSAIQRDLVVAVR